MIEALEIVLIIFVLLCLLIPVFFNIIKIKLWEYIVEKLDEQNRHERLRKDMKQRKEGNQGKTHIK